VPAGSDLYGDEQYVFAVPQNSRTAQVFSTVDGRLLGEKSVPLWGEQLATRGRQVIRWRRLADARQELSAVDCFTADVIWKHDFEKGARVDVTQNRYVAVVERSGHCTIVDAQEGQRLVDQPLDSDLTVQQIHLFAGADDFVVALQQPSKANKNQRLTGFNHLDSIVFTGKIHVFDSNTGQKLYDRPAEVVNQVMMLTQPVDLPIIAFAGNSRRRDRNGGKQVISMLLLEKGSGRTLFHDEALPESVNHCVVRASDMPAHEVVVEMVKQEVHLEFTGLPRAPEPPALVGVQRLDKAGPKGLQRIGEKLWGGR